MKTTNAKPAIIIGLAILLCLAAIVVYQGFRVQKAHSSFENYYAFRGCQKLIEKTDTYGTCQLSSGQTIKMVLADGGWYLDGDLPCPGPKLSLKFLSCAL